MSAHVFFLRRHQRCFALVAWRVVDLMGLEVECQRGRQVRLADPETKGLGLESRRGRQVKLVDPEVEGRGLEKPAYWRLARDAVPP